MKQAHQEAPTITVTEGGLVDSMIQHEGAGVPIVHNDELQARFNAHVEGIDPEPRPNFNYDAMFKPKVPVSTQVRKVGHKVVESVGKALD